MRLLRIVAVGMSALAGFSSCAPAFAQRYWQDRHFQQWTEKECQKLLEDSPWAQRFTHARTIVEFRAGRSGGERGDEANPQFHYLAQIRSALPIRRALVRQKQLEANYDKLSPERQKVLDQQFAEFLSREFADGIVVYVLYWSNVMAYSQEMGRRWQMLPPEVARNQIFLVGPRRQRITPVSYEVAPGAFQVVFPREVNGQPLLTPDDKHFKIEFMHPNLGEQGDAQVVLEFDLRKMVVRGSVVY